jgi:hypothetical protein
VSDNRAGRGRLIFWLSCAVLAALFAVSAAFTLRDSNYARRIFYFQGQDGAVYTEIRRLAQNADPVERYVKELLLGAENTRLKALFNPATRARACFVRGNVVYLNLSEHALFPLETTSSMKEGAELLSKNVLRNFRAIERVSLFINGEKAYEKNESPTTP